MLDLSEPFRRFGFLKTHFQILKLILMAKNLIIIAAFIVASFSAQAQSLASNEIVYVGKKCPACNEMPMSFVSAVSAKETARTVTITPNYKRGEMSEDFKFSTVEKSNEFLPSGFYTVELPKIYTKEIITVKVMFDQYIVKQMNFTPSDKLSFDIELIENQTLRIELH